MKKLILSLLLIYMVVIPDLQAQTEKTNKLGLHWGIGHLQRQDINFSPFIYNPTTAFNLGFTYEHKGKHFHRVYSRFGRYKDWFNGQAYDYSVDWSGEWESVELLPNSFNILDLNYAFGVEMISKNNLSILLGGQARNLLNQGVYDYGNHGIGYYNFSFGIDVWSGLNYIISDKHSIGAELSLPIIAWVTKSPYLGQDDEFFDNNRDTNTFNILGNYIKSGRIESWGQTQRIDLQLVYSYKLGERWALNGRYALNMNTFNSPNRYRSVEHILLIGAEIKL